MYSPEKSPLGWIIKFTLSFLSAVSTPTKIPKWEMVKQITTAAEFPYVLFCKVSLVMKEVRIKKKGLPFFTVLVSFLILIFNFLLFFNGR